jgi:NAD(P)H dehydrogenase (quinone)
MSNVKLTIVFYSTYGTNHMMAQEAADAAKAAGAEVRLRRAPETAPKEVVQGQDAWRDQLERMQDIPEVSLDDMEWANAYFFSAPTRFGVVASQMRAFIDRLGPLWQSGKLAGKPVTATTSAQNAHGGQEATILSLYTTFMHWGSVIVAPGYADPIKFEDGGNPYGYSTNAGTLDDIGRKSIAYQTRRLVEMAAKMAA